MKTLFRGILFTAIFLTCLDFIGTGLWLRHVPRSFQDDWPEVPAVAVLIHDFNRETGALGPETKRRLNFAIQLYAKGVVGRIVCIGGARPRFHMFGSEHMREYLMEAGIPPEHISADKTSFDTTSNWKIAYRIARDQKWSAMGVISSPFHLYRARQIINEEGPKENLEVVFMPYSLTQSNPPKTLIDIWSEIHYEWRAYLSNLLPEFAYKRIIHYLRGSFASKL
jgi:uncharacterized SAM-binding protein YcdF (DUF218 family)